MVYLRPSGFLYSLLLLAVAFATGCQQSYVPKPRGYHRIDLPARAYQQLMLKLPYAFEYSTSAQAHPDSDRNSEPNWMDLYYPAFDATVDFTYKPVNGDMKKLNEYIEDARKLTNRHQVKASGIDERIARAGSGNIAYIFRLEGEVPTQYQFFVTDSSRHFLRAALYFKTSTRNDSLRPVIDYIAKDMEHVIGTLKWK